MFYFLWAIKGLSKNYLRTIRNIFFIALVTSIVFLLFAFRQGAQEQMEASVRTNYGDIEITSRERETSLEEVEAYIKKEYSGIMETLLPELWLNNVLINHGTANEFGRISGISASFFEIMEDHIYWVEGEPFQADSSSEAVIETSFAEQLNIGVGDVVTVRYTTQEGAINTARFIISGIFTGIADLHGGGLFTSLEAARFLSLLEGNWSNQIKFYLYDADDALLLQVYDDLSEKFAGKVRINVFEWRDEVGFAQIFRMVWMLMLLLLSLVSAVILIVLYFAVYNNFYMSFYSRTKEIASLLTFGMKHSSLYLRSFFEGLIIMIAGIGIGFIFALFFSSIFESITYSGSMETYVMVLGGPYLRFSFIAKEVLLISLFLGFTGLWASFKSLHNYLKLEVREIASINL